MDSKLDATFKFKIGDFVKLKLHPARYIVTYRRLDESEHGINITYILGQASINYINAAEIELDFFDRKEDEIGKKN